MRHFNRHYHVLPRDISCCEPVGTFDFITCLSVLEAVDDHRRVVRGMFDHLAPGGAIAIATPYNDRRFVGDAHTMPGAGYGADLPYPCRQYSRVEVEQWLADNGARIVDEQQFRCFTGAYWTMGERLWPAVPVGRDEQHHLACLLLERR
jgi:2-polyprenyl-3-methyl-5-hydroxy-6-metoxy-1,4-benzoquinol methylase